MINCICLYCINVYHTKTLAVGFPDLGWGSSLFGECSEYVASTLSFGRPALSIFLVAIVAINIYTLTLAFQRIYLL